MRIRSTTIFAVRRDGKLAIAGDGQVTLDKTIVKHSARKVRKIAGGKVLAGLRRFGAADGITLLEKFENKSREFKRHHARCRRAGQGLASGPRAAPSRGAADRRQPRAPLRALRGTGDVIEPDEGIAAIGSGGPYAQAAATALLAPLRASTPRRSRAKRWRSPAKICIYTNDDITVETLP